MTNATMETRGAFGETLEALMRSRGMGPGPDEIRDLATAAGLDPEKMLAAVMDDSATADLEPDFSGLARALSLDEDEMRVIAMAYTYGKPGTKALRALMRSKKSLARLAVEDRGGLCFFGANTEHPCEREAVATHPEPGETEIVLCAEHARAYRLRDDADTLHDALEMLHRWIQDGAPGEDSYAADIVRDGLYHQREALERRYFDTLIKRRGADLMADGAPTGPDKAWEYPPSLEAAEALARSNLISDALGNALAVVEDAPAEAFGNITDRHEVAAALQAAHEDASRASRGDRERAGLSSRSE